MVGRTENDVRTGWAACKPVVLHRQQCTDAPGLHAFTRLQRRDLSLPTSSKADSSSKAAAPMFSSSTGGGTYSGSTLDSRRSVSRSSRMLLALLVTSSRYRPCLQGAGCAQQVCHLL
jgi:hypothetical protein